MVEKTVPALNKKGVLGKLVHVQGSLKGQTLQDKQYGVEVKNALSLRRGTEMYQWVEEEEPNESNDERFVTYRHHTEWVGSHVDTRSFRDKKSAGTYKNPARPSLQPFEDRVRTIEVGELKTSPEFSPKLLRFKPLDIKRPNDKDSFSRSVAMVKKIPRNYVLRHMCESDVCQGVLYSSAKAVSQPEVGDARVRFQYAPAEGTVSLIGTKTKSGIGPYVAENGRSIALASRGKVDAEELLRGAVSENSIWTWLMRGGGVLLAFVGLLLVLSPINVLASYLSFVPLLGSLVGGLVGMAVFAVALLGALSCSVIVIAAAWLYYRPVLAAVALCIGLGGLYVSSRWARAGKQPAKQA